MIVYVERFAHGDQIRGGLELAGFGGFLCAVDPIPVEPGDLVVLAIRVVVAVLRVAEFVSCEQHGRAKRENERAEHVHARTFACALDAEVVGGALHAEVGGMVHVRAVVVVLAIRLVVLVVVAGEVGQCKAVVRADVIDR